MGRRRLSALREADAMVAMIKAALQGWLAVAVGVLLALITLFSSYNHVDIPGIGNVGLNQQVGVLLLAALVPALLGDAELATRRRLRAESDRIREKESIPPRYEDRSRAEDEAAAERNRAAAERNRAAEAREQAARRARRQARCDRIAFQHQLEPTADHARQLRNVIALLAEYGEFACIGVSSVKKPHAPRLP